MTDRPTRIDARVVLYREDGSWIAHCLDFDLLGDGDCQGAAVGCLMEAMRLQLEATAESGNWANLFRPAEPECHLLYARGEVVGVAEGPALPSGDYRIGRVEIRQSA